MFSDIENTFQKPALNGMFGSSLGEKLSRFSPQSKYWYLSFRSGLRHGQHWPGGISLFLQSKAPQTETTATSSEPAALFRLHRQRGGGLLEHPARGGEAGADHLEHLGNKIQNPRPGPQLASIARPGSWCLALSSLSISQQLINWTFPFVRKTFI